MVNPLEQIFPRLGQSGYQITSPADADYNCVAWAAGENRQWWWPGPDHEREYWSAGAAREATLVAFQAAFALLGYAVCASTDAEAGFEKIAVYADAQGKPRHAARQVVSGRWTSKLGRGPDIEYPLIDLEGDEYGSVVLTLRRAIS